MSAEKNKEIVEGIFKRGIVFQFDNGKIARLSEYCNTDLFRKTFPELNM